jgi:hypothetical protein
MLQIGANVIDAVIEGNVETCPYCGGEAYTLDARIDNDGRLQFIRRFYHILTNSGAVNQDLEYLQARLEDLWLRDMSQEEVVVALESEEQKFPGLTDFVRDYWPKVRNVGLALGAIDGVLNFLERMVQIIQLVQALNGRPEEPPQELIDRFMNETAIPAQVQQGRSIATPTHTHVIQQPIPRPLPIPTVIQPTKSRTTSKATISPRQQRKQARANTPCPCGSGVPRKECHGAKK